MDETDAVVLVVDINGNRVHLTDEELEREIGQLHSYYLHTAITMSHKEYVNLNARQMFNGCQINLTKQIEETEGALVGAAMAIEEVDMELSEEEKKL